MTELDDIKARAAELRRRYWSPPYPMSLPATKVLTDLDRAIALAEGADRFATDCWSSHQAQKTELDLAQADAEESDRHHTSACRERNVAWGQRDQARADVLKLRDSIQRCLETDAKFPFMSDNRPDHHSALADTEHYEQYR